MAIEVEPTSSIERNRYLNRMDKAYVLICMIMSLELLFHIEACTTLDEIWKMLESLFGKKDEFRGHMIKVGLNSLDTRSFEDIQELFMEFKYILLHLIGCCIDKSTQCNQLIFSILEKNGLKYFVFVSTFHIVRFTLGATWKILTLDKFIESLKHE